MAEDLVIHVRKTSPAVVNPLRRDNRVLVDHINKNIADSHDQMISHRKILAGSVLPSRDVVLTADNLEDLKCLICSRAPWIKVLEPNTAIKRRGYPIAVYGMDITRIGTGDSAKHQDTLTE